MLLLNIPRQRRRAQQRRRQGHQLEIDLHLLVQHRVHEQVPVPVHDLILDLPRRSSLHLKGVDRRRGDIFHAGQSDLGKDRPPEFLLRVQNRTGESDDRNPTGILGHLHILDVDAALLADNPEQMGPAHVLAHTCGIGRGDDPAVSIDDRKPTIDLIVLAHPI